MEKNKKIKWIKLVKPIEVRAKLNVECPECGARGFKSDNYCAMCGMKMREDNNEQW